MEDTSTTAQEATEQPTVLIAVYGTLRRDGVLHEAYMAVKGLSYKGTITLPGFKLWDLGAYPVAEPTAHTEDRVTVDVFTIPESAYDRIHDMEQAAGYIAVPVHTEWGEALMFTGFPATPIPSGDWIAYRQEQDALQKALYK